MIQKILIILIFLLVINIPAFGLPKNFHAVVTPGNIQFQLVDPLGNVTGYDPNIGVVYTNIPNTMYYLFEEPDITMTNKDNSHYSIKPQKFSNTTLITTGNYKLKIFGTTTTENMNLYFYVFYQNIIGAQIMAEHSSIIYPNVIWTYEITIPDVPPAAKNVPLIKVSSPQDLIIDINAAGSLGYIGNAHFVSETIEKINEIEKERIKPAEKDDDHSLTPAQKAKKEYTELLSEITEKYNKPENNEFVKKEGYDVLKEDLDYIISHL